MIFFYYIIYFVCFFKSGWELAEACSFSGFLLLVFFLYLYFDDVFCFLNLNDNVFYGVSYVFYHFCVLKKWVHSRIGQCVRPSVRPSGRPAGRLHDNFWKNSPIVMKFSTQHYLINISLEFEDGHDSSRIYWFSAGTTVIFPIILMEILTHSNFRKSRFHI